MADLADIDHLYGQDVAVTPSGDIAVVTNRQRTIQRVIRRLLSTKTGVANSAYPCEPDYGAGLAAKIGQTFTVSEIQALVLGQLLQEPSVAPSPAPRIAVTPIVTGGATIDIFCFDRSGTPQNFSFGVS